MLFIAKLLDLVPNWVYAGLLILAGLYMFGQSREIVSLQKNVEKVTASLEKEKALRVEERLLAISELNRIAGNIRASTKVFETSLEDLTNAYKLRIQAQVSVIDGLRRDGRVYRDNIRSFSSPQDGQSGANSAEGALLDCRNRVAVLGEILERTDEFAERVTAEAEQRIEQVRALQPTVLAMEAYIQSFSKNFETPDIR